MKRGFHEKKKRPKIWIVFNKLDRLNETACFIYRNQSSQNPRSDAFSQTVQKNGPYAVRQFADIFLAETGNGDRGFDG